MRTKRAVVLRATLSRRLIRDEGGTASLEFSIILAGLAAAALVAAATLGPALHDYADRMSQIADHADAVLDRLDNAVGS